MGEDETQDQGAEKSCTREAVDAGISYGQCSECGCPAYGGEGTYCTRCGHHWKSHQAM